MSILLDICLILIFIFATFGIAGGLYMMAMYSFRNDRKSVLNKIEEKESSDQTITSEADKMISDLSSSFEKYLADRVFDRAKILGRKCADIADFNGVVFELSLDNKLIYKLLEKKGK